MAEYLIESDLNEKIESFEELGLNDALLRGIY